MVADRGAAQGDQEVVLGAGGDPLLDEPCVVAGDVEERRLAAPAAHECGHGDAGGGDDLVAADGLARQHEFVAGRQDRHALDLPLPPTSASWLNAVEGFFAKLSRRLKRSVFRSLNDLEVAINRFVSETNNDPRPFV